MIELYDETLHSATTIQSMHECEMITSMNKHKFVHHFKIHLIISLLNTNILTTNALDAILTPVANNWISLIMFSCCVQVMLDSF